MLRNLGLVVTSCGDSGGDSTTPPAASATQLAGTQWNLQTQGNSDVAGASTVRAGYRLRGDGPRHGERRLRPGFTGTYQQKGDDGLTFGPLAGTQKACAARQRGRTAGERRAEHTFGAHSGGLLNLLNSAEAL